MMSNSQLATYKHFTSNMSYGRGGKKIDKIFVHHMAGNLTVEQCGRVFDNNPASAHYGINGSKIGQYVDESNTAWHCGNFAYNQRSIGIECANDGGAAKNWHVSDTTINTLIKLLVDICLRNGIEKLKYTGDLSGNLCMHCMTMATACPGGYLKTKFKYIANEVNKRISKVNRYKALKKMPLRKAARSDSEQIDVIPKGKVHTALDKLDKGTSEWIKIKHDGQVGWVCVKYKDTVYFRKVV